MTFAVVTAGRGLNLLAAVIGAVGALILYKHSFTYESASYYGDEEFWKAMAERNHKRQRWQRAGMLAIMIGFVLQAISQFME